MKTISNSLWSKLWVWLWKEEWNFNHPKYRSLLRKLAGLIAVISAITIPIGLATSLHLLDFLGPGLGVETSYEQLKSVVGELQASGNMPLAIAFVILLVAVLGFRSYCIYLAYYDYAENIKKYPYDEKDKQNKPENDEGFPLDVFFLFIFYNAFMLIGAALVLVLLGMGAMLLGFDFQQGYEVLQAIVHAADHLAYTYVPTIIDLPPFIALAIIYTLTGFFHYWLHRLAHEFRLLWLLLHRPHHMPESLMEPITTGVVVAFPIGFIVMFPYVLFFGAISKLFSAEPLYFEVMLLNLMVYIGATSAHSTALYHLGFKYKWLGWLGYVFGTAQYHYLHHASHPVYSRHDSNLTNIGGGFCFMWDRVHGTYIEPPQDRPRIGLTGQPPLHKNPFRLLMAGLWQIVYELKHNKSWKVRWKILTGPSDYYPPVTKDFALKSGAKPGVQNEAPDGATGEPLAG